MLYYLWCVLAKEFSLLNVVHYITVRSGCAILLSLIISFIMAPKLIPMLRKRQKHGQPIREDGPSSHLINKAQTPTMGGIMIISSVMISTLLLCDLTNPFVWIVVFSTISFGGLGALDDYLKISRKSPQGLRALYKFLVQLLFFAITIGLIIYYDSAPEYSYKIALPFFKYTFLDLGILFIPFAFFVIVGSSNAVNLTDGLDGLAIVPVMIVYGCFAIICYLAGHKVFASYLHITHIPGAGELTVICCAFIGAGLGFLWYNAPPAKIFMGDIGSLSLGASLGVISIITKHEFILAISGGLFVIETVSVMLQVVYYKFTGKRVFLMAPIHHHFEQKGWAEPTIVIRFWIISVVLALFALSTLKLR